jgi:hypothetical protein
MIKPWAALRRNGYLKVLSDTGSRLPQFRNVGNPTAGSEEGADGKNDQKPGNDVADEQPRPQLTS